MPSPQSPAPQASIIIIGQGLAGSLLAWTLMQQGVNVCIYSDGKASASRVAAGLINPVTGQRFVLAEQTPQMLKYAQIFYQDIEKKLNIQCYFPLSMQRLFNSEKEQIHCHKRLKDIVYNGYLGASDMPTELQAKYSGITQQHTAWLDTNILLDALSDYFEQQQSIKHTLFANHESITSKQKIIFCEGYKMMDNPLFSWLPMQAAHGEIITCKSKETLPAYIINKSKWLLPHTSLTCRVGATYETGLSTPTLQESSQQTLLDFARHLFKTDKGFTVVDHQAGIRPATQDKQPFIGFHSKHNNIGIFNGFGSRGSLMIPHYAKALTDYISQKKAIPQEVDIKRYNILCS